MARCEDCNHENVCRRFCGARVILCGDKADQRCSMFQPAADVVKVVRCKDCDVPHNKWTGCPNLNGMIPPPYFYCARGERKEQTDGNV